MKNYHLLLLLFLLPYIWGATIQGNIYDESLNPIENTIIKINTTPIQQIVAKQNSYTIEVPEGKYELIAINNEKKFVTLITIQDQDQVSLFDIILFEDIEEYDQLYNITDDIQNDEILEEEKEIQESISLWLYALILGGILLVVLLGIIVMYTKRVNNIKQHPSEIDDKQKIKTYIESQGGRTTQKDVRQQFATLSEAKISLIISELEDQHYLKKIKKGKSNVLIKQ